MTAQQPQSSQQDLLLYDGDCQFCCQSAARWECKAGDALRVKTAQSGAGADYGIGADQKIKAVILVEADGKIFTGAGAVIRLLKSSRWGMLLWNLYERVMPFRVVADWVYRFVASHRLLISRLIKKRDNRIQ